MRRIRVATFNILHGVLADGSGRVDENELMRSAASLRADVLALQEVDVGVTRSGRTDQSAVVAAALGMQVAFGRTSRIGLVGRFGNALLVRGAISDVEVRPMRRSSWRHTPRGMLLATATVGGTPPASVTVAVAHLSVRRPEVFVQLEEVLDALVARAAGRPCLLLGDLNLNASELAPVEAAGLTVADATLPTFPRAAPRARIDHIAVGGLEVEAVEVVATATSDHCALVADVNAG